MKLATFTYEDIRDKRPGLVMGSRITDLREYLRDESLTLLSIIKQWDEFGPSLQALEKSGTRGRPLEEVALHAPIERPGKILAIGLNYRDHIEECGLETPKQQLWFSKVSSCSNGPFDPIEIPRVSREVDYEAELVAIVGKHTRHASKAAAKDAIFGFCIGNDVSVRDWQFATTQWSIGKSFDTHGPFGPWIVTADELDNPHDLGIRCFVNGEIRQDSNTRHLVFNVYDQVIHLSKAMTLEPGDVLFTGTPGGVGFAMNPKSWLQPGDRVRVEIDKLGSIEATLVLEEA